MNTVKKVSSSFSRWIVVLVGAALVISLAFTIPSGTVAAASAVPTRTPGAGMAQLTQAFQHEQQVLAQQQANLGRTGGVVSKIQDLISKAQARGVDTAALSAALGTFQSQVATAAGANTTAAGILSAHAGFDGSGNVTDVAAARQTVQAARQNLLDAHNTLVQAAADLHTAVSAWQAANKDKVKDQSLQKDYQNEQNWLTIQQGNLAGTALIVTRTQELISLAQARGLDTSVLSTALNTFQEEIATATSHHTTAAEILSAHAGFDGSGNVTDTTAASQTVKAADQSLSDARNILVQSVNDLQNVILQWRETHEPAATPAPTATGG